MALKLKASNLSPGMKDALKARKAANSPGGAHAAFRAAEAEHEGASKKWVDAMIAKHPDEEAHRGEKNKAEQRVEAARKEMHAAEHERHGVHPNDIRAGSKEGLSLREGAGPLEKKRHEAYGKLQDARQKTHDAAGAYYGAYDASDLPDMRKEEHAAKEGVKHAHAEYEKAHEAFAGSHEAKPAAPKAAHDPAHAARRADAEKATKKELESIGENLHEQHLSGEKSAHQINEEHALHKERLINEHLAKTTPAAPKSAQEQHADKLKTFASSGKAAESSKRVGQMLTSRKMTAAAKAPTEKQAIQTSARGAKFYVARSGEKIYVK